MSSNNQRRCPLLKRPGQEEGETYEGEVEDLKRLAEMDLDELRAKLAVCLRPSLSPNPGYGRGSINCRALPEEGVCQQHLFSRLLFNGFVT